MGNPSQQQVTPQYIFEKLGITDSSASQGMTTARLMIELRESAGWAINELAAEIGKSPSRINGMQTSCYQHDVDRLLEVLKPRLQKLAKEGWLDAASLTVNEERYRQVRAACRSLREQNNLSSSRFEKKLRATATSFDVKKFENGTYTVATLLSAAERLCEFSGKPLDELLEIGKEALAAEEPSGGFRAAVTRRRAARLCGGGIGDE